MYSLSNLTKYQTIITSIKALPEGTATQEYVMTLLIEGSKRISHGRTHEQMKTEGTDATIAVSLNVNGRQRRTFQSSGR